MNAVYINKQQEYQYMRKKMTFNIRYTVIHEAMRLVIYMIAGNVFKTSYLSFSEQKNK